MRPLALLPLALFLLPLAVPPAAPADAPDVRASVDLFLAVHTTSMTFEDACGGTFTPDPDGRGFDYREDDAAGDQGVFSEGQASSGCGYARLGIELPPGADRLDISFLADRRIDSARSAVMEGGESRQSVRLRDQDTDLLVHEVEYYPATDGSRPMTLHDLPEVFLPSMLRNASLEFFFQDVPPLGPQVGPTAGGSLSGRGFAARVQDIHVRVLVEPDTDVDADTQERREGTLLLDELRVRLDVRPVPGFQATPRVVAGTDLDFAYLLRPDGRRVDDARTWNGTLAGQDAVLLRRGADSLEVLLGPALVDAAGEGTYTLVLQSTQTVRVSPALLPVALVLLATPLPFAVLAIVQARVFHREAFGAYRRSARNLMIAVVVVFAYYLAVVASALVAGRLDLMAVWPLPAEGVLLYVQVAAAVGAFVLLWLAARELFWITRPRGASHDEP